MTGSRRLLHALPRRPGRGLPHHRQPRGDAAAVQGLRGPRRGADAAHVDGRTGALEVAPVRALVCHRQPPFSVLLVKSLI